MRPSMSDSGSSSAWASSRMTDAFSLAGTSLADADIVTRIGQAGGMVAKNNLTTILSH